MLPSVVQRVSTAIRFNLQQQEHIMKAELTAIIETAPEGGFWTICPEIPCAKCVGRQRILIEA